MLQTLQGKGCLFPMCKHALAPNKSLWGSRFQKFCPRKGIYQTQHLPEGSTTNLKPQKGASKGRAATTDTRAWEPSRAQGGNRGTWGTVCLLGSSGDRGCPELWLSNSSRPWVPQSSAQASSAAERELDPLKLSIISQDWWNSHSLKSECEVSDEGCSLQTTLRSPCCWYYHKNKQKCRFLFRFHRAAGLTN